MPDENDAAFKENVAITSKALQQAIEAVETRIIGYRDVIRKLFIAILAEGHILVEGVPGIAKTKMVVELAKIIGIQSARVQCTPDLLPSDITGMTLFRPDTGKFEMHKGPVFTHILIADEVNRTPPKVQSALLEAMAEKQVTIFGNTEKLLRPFFVMATQNPIEQEGTYPLPEAQLDRFMLKVLMKTLGVAEEKEIMEQSVISTKRAESVPLRDGEKFIQEAIETARKIYVDPVIIDYIAKIIVKTRESQGKIRLGASPRASLALLQGARANALIDGRAYVTPQDVKYLAQDALRHRIVVNFEQEAKGVDSISVVDEILSQIPTP